MRLSLNDLFLALQGECVASNFGDFDGSAIFDFSRLSIDTRTMKTGDIYLALVGRCFDGNDFVSAAVDSGAVLVIASRLGSMPGVPTIIVSDARRALSLMASKARSMLSATKFIAITGSTGKTTTKDMMKVYMSCYGDTGGTLLNLNNDIGVPKTILALSCGVEYAVVEMGMNHEGEIRSLVNLVRPQVGVITSIDMNHIEHFSTVQDIARTKGEILVGISENGSIVLNRDDKFYAFLASLARGRGFNVLTYGMHEEAHVRLLSCQSVGELIAISVAVGEHTLSYAMRDVGLAVASNSLAVVAAACALGLDPVLGCDRLIDFTLPVGKGNVMHIDLPGSRSVSVIDESYNSGPAAVRANLGRLRSFDCKRRVAILADMLELGDYAEKAHAELVQHIKQSVDMLITVGPQMCALNKDGPTMASADELIPALNSMLLDGDVILVKGSRRWGLEKVVAALNDLSINLSASS